VQKTTRFVGLDVHAETIAVAVAEAGRDGEVRSLGTIPNRPESVRKLVRKLGQPETLRVCYEAGPCGFVLYWQLVELGVQCDVVAPTLVPVKAGDRVKTDGRDAVKLARGHRAGELTAVWVPDADHEALRDLVRAREAGKKDQLRARHRLGKFLLRRGHRRPQGMSAWGVRHMEWLRGIRFERQPEQATMTDYLSEVDHQVARIKRLEAAIDVAVADAPAALQALVDGLQALRGIRKLTALTIATEVGWMSRFTHPRLLMGYSGIVPSEHSSGSKTSRGAITRSGNAHLRRVLVEAAWAYRFAPALREPLRKRQDGLSAAVREVSWKAQHRLHGRYRRLAGRGKPKPQVITAVARELVGFIWAIGVQVEREQQPNQRPMSRQAA
jgi:transposase